MIITVAFGLGVGAQTKPTLFAKYAVFNGPRVKNRPSYHWLFTNDTLSLWVDDTITKTPPPKVEVTAYVIDENGNKIPVNTDEFKKETEEDLAKHPCKCQSFLVKKPSEGKLYFSYAGKRKKFLVEDSLPAMQWQLGDSTVNFMGYRCKVGKTFFRGRHYTAYYTDTLGIMDGPWKFYGLPGLILYVKSDDGFYKMQAVELTYPYKGRIPKPSLPKKKISWKTYLKKQKRYYDQQVEKQKIYLMQFGEFENGNNHTFKLNGWEVIHPVLSDKGVEIE